MQIDVLSQNTLKLTLSRLDMFDMDIKYESLSGKNPDTKRLLSHVLRTVKLDKSAGVDFSGERLFVEAFPRPDGGCMLYISCLSEERERVHSFVPDRKTVRLTAKSPPAKQRPAGADKSAAYKLLCRFDSIKDLDGVCKNLFWHQNRGKINFTSTLYSNSNEYRLLICGNNKKLISAIVSEYGELLTPEHELSFTCEHYNLLVPENAVEKMNSVL
jgi:negative regulator of genetic competence, sporulation and motility